MANKKDRYLVYYFDRDAMADLESEGLDEEEVFEPRNVGFVTQFGELVFSSNDSDEVLDKTSEYIQSFYDNCSVYDTEEHKWFN